MPLKHSPSNAARSYNIAEMINAGHPPDQAKAAAYRNQREAKHAPPKRKVKHLMRPDDEEMEPARDDEAEEGEPDDAERASMDMARLKALISGKSSTVKRLAKPYAKQTQHARRAVKYLSSPGAKKEMRYE